jgi:hypothetical protein
VALVEWRRSRRVGYPAVKELEGSTAASGSTTVASPAPPSPPLPKGESPIDDAGETSPEAPAIEVNLSEVNASDAAVVSEAATDEEAA